MASVHEIAIKLTASTGSVQTSLDKVKDRIDSLTQARKKMGFVDTLEAKRTDDRIARLKRLREELERNARAETSAASTPGHPRGVAGALADDNAHNKAIKGNGRLAQSFTQLSYGVEDFLAVYGTMGFAGAMRGAGNNLSMVARILAGPFAGGIMGAAIVGLPLFIAATRTAKQEQEEFAKALKKSADAGDDWFKTQQRMAMRDLEHGFLMRDLDKIKDIKQLEDRLAGIGDNLDRINLKSDLAGGGFKRAFDTAINTVLGDDVGEKLMDQIVDPAFKKEVERFKAIRKNFETEFRDNFQLDPEVAVKHLTSDLEKLLADMPAYGVGSLDPNPMEILRAFGLAEVTAKDMQKRAIILEQIEALLMRAKAAATEANAKAEEMQSIQKNLDDLEKSKVEHLKEQAKLREEIKKSIEAAQNAESMDQLNRAAQSPLQRIIQGVKDDMDKLRDVFENSQAGPEQLAAFRTGRDNILKNAIDGLSGNTKEQTKVFKDAMQSGPNSAEAAESAKRAAEAQVEAAKNQKKDATNKDVVDAIKILSDTLKNGQLIAVPVGP